MVANGLLCYGGVKLLLTCRLTDECMSSGTYTELLNYATNFNVPLLIHIVVCSSGLNNGNYDNRRIKRTN